jgi:hypothetical protein
MLSFSSLDLKNYSPKTAYSPENESDPIDPEQYEKDIRISFEKKKRLILPNMCRFFLRTKTICS